MTRINKSKDGRIGPEPTAGIVLPEPVAPKPLKRMNKAELIYVALNRSNGRIDVKGLTKAQLIEALEK